jgi:hypothetical protein
LDLFAKHDVRGSLLGLLRAIQKSVETDPTLQAQPAIQQVLVELNERFLDPIRHLFS